MNMIAPEDAGQIAGAPLPASRSVTAVRAALTFIRPQAEKPVLHSAALTGDRPAYFFETEAREVAIHDMRPLAHGLTLDAAGFALHHAPTAVADLYDDAAVAERYIPETAALLTHEFEASRVAIFDATRRSDAGQGAANRDGARGPAGRIHVDYTAASGPKRAADVLGKDAFDHAVARGARILQVNVWRPIRGPVERSPLALADAASVRPEDLIATDQLFPDRVGEIYHLAQHPDQRWYYAPRMTRDEVLLIKGWDSLDDGRARFTPHSAFSPPAVRKDAPARESIELRSFVVIG